MTEPKTHKGIAYRLSYLFGYGVLSIGALIVGALIVVLVVRGPKPPESWSPVNGGAHLLSSTSDQWIPRVSGSSGVAVRPGECGQYNGAYFHRIACPPVWFSDEAGRVGTCLRSDEAGVPRWRACVTEGGPK